MPGGPPILICTYRKGAVHQAHDLWGDLRVSLWSVDAYVPKDVDVYVAWDGPSLPDNVPASPNFHYIERPSGLALLAAFNWLVDQIDHDSFVFLQDDAVLNEYSYQLLVSDVENLKTVPKIKLGCLGARSNYVVGPQNVRHPNNGVIEDDSSAFTSEQMVFESILIFPVLAWFDKTAFNEVGQWETSINWLADNLLSFDLAQHGWNLVVSQAYVHHIGSRSTRNESRKSEEQMSNESWTWLRNNRPDFIAAAEGTT